MDYSFKLLCNKHHAFRDKNTSTNLIGINITFALDDLLRYEVKFHTYPVNDGKCIQSCPESTVWSSNTLVQRKSQYLMGFFLYQHSWFPQAECDWLWWNNRRVCLQKLASRKPLCLVAYTQFVFFFSDVIFKSIHLIHLSKYCMLSYKNNTTSLMLIYGTSLPGSLSKLEPNQYIGWPILLGDFGLPQMYSAVSYQCPCYPISADIKILIIIKFLVSLPLSQVFDTHILGIIAKKLCVYIGQWLRNCGIRICLKNHLSSPNVAVGEVCHQSG